MTVVEDETGRVHYPPVPAQLLEGDIEGGSVAVGMGGGLLWRPLQQAQRSGRPRPGQWGRGAPSPLPSTGRLGPCVGHQEGGGFGPSGAGTERTTQQERQDRMGQQREGGGGQVQDSPARGGLAQRHRHRHGTPGCQYQQAEQGLRAVGGSGLLSVQSCVEPQLGRSHLAAACVLGWLEHIGEEALLSLSSIWLIPAAGTCRGQREGKGQPPSAKPGTPPPQQEGSGCHSQACQAPREVLCQRPGPSPIFRELTEAPPTTCSVPFSSVAQSCPTLRPRGLQHTRPPCPSPISGVYSNSCPLDR